MVTVEGTPTVTAIGQVARLNLPVSKGGIARIRDYSLTREQLTALIAHGIDALDAMDEAQAETAHNVTPLFAHKAAG